MTGLLNRRAFTARMATEIARARRQGFTSALLILDIDHFKRINDRWGHPFGDLALKAFADTCRTTSRDIDSVARIGGEEFAILLPNSSLLQAQAMAERVRRQVEVAAMPQPADGGRLRMTVSIGVATTTPDATPEELVSRADEALYAAKQGGRNRVEGRD